MVPMNDSMAERQRSEPDNKSGGHSTRVGAEAVKIRGVVLTSLRQHARERPAEECCGLLLGTGDTVSALVATANTAADPRRRYEIDAATHFNAIRLARRDGLEVIGAYHSHPRSAPIPSATDQAEAFDAFLFVIVGGRPEEIRAWRWHEGNFAEVVLVPVP